MHGVDVVGIGRAGTLVAHAKLRVALGGAVVSLEEPRLAEARHVVGEQDRVVLNPRLIRAPVHPREPAHRHGVPVHENPCEGARALRHVGHLERERPQAHARALIGLSAELAVGIGQVALLIKLHVDLHGRISSLGQTKPNRYSLSNDSIMSKMASPYLAAPCSEHQTIVTLTESSSRTGVTMTTAYTVSSGSATS